MRHIFKREYLNCCIERYIDRGFERIIPLNVWLFDKVYHILHCLFKDVCSNRLTHMNFAKNESLMIVDTRVCDLLDINNFNFILFSQK